MKERAKPFFLLIRFFTFSLLICICKYSYKSTFGKSWAQKSNVNSVLNIRHGRLLRGDTIVGNQESYSSLKEKMLSLLNKDHNTFGERLRALIQDDNFRKYFNKLIHDDDFHKEFKGVMQQSNNKKQANSLNIHDNLEKQPNPLKESNYFEKYSDPLKHYDNFEKHISPFKNNNNNEKLVDNLKHNVNYQRLNSRGSYDNNNKFGQNLEKQIIPETHRNNFKVKKKRKSVLGKFLNKKNSNNELERLHMVQTEPVNKPISMRYPVRMPRIAQFLNKNKSYIPFVIIPTIILTLGLTAILLGVNTPSTIAFAISSGIALAYMLY
ncbi:Plasmodium exported protein, unknown function [Plasmodium ovale]|uniref:Pv-fam-d protein n=1 Tax=Plasmodium ovale TaxID=36330 RepID=A0A1C3KKV2_PLAOA|nr:Plasmodium exported protein, unknown function [Plasmodium ovale]